LKIDWTIQAKSGLTQRHQSVEQPKVLPLVAAAESEFGAWENMVVGMLLGNIELK
jgi:hypothetical protein